MPLAQHRYNTGQGLVEYALIVLFISLAAVTALTALGVTLDSFYSRVVPALSP
mgnify:CR=1 FL=1